MCKLAEREEAIPFCKALFHRDNFDGLNIRTIISGQNNRFRGSPVEQLAAIRFESLGNEDADAILEGFVDAARFLREVNAHRYPGDF